MALFALLLCLGALAGCAGGVELVGSAGGDAASAGNCSRSSPCFNYGNCELHTGACACPPGYGGRRCERALLSACALTRSPATDRPVSMLCSHTPSSFGVRSCDCLRQCAAHMPAEMVYPKPHGACFERPGGVEVQTSDFPDADEVGVVYRRSSSPAAAANATMTRDEYLLLQDSAQRVKSEPQRVCKDSCNFEGRCMRRSDGDKREFCFCHVGRVGEACEGVQPLMCFNNCSGTGTCHRGFCSCQMGFFGIDCSIDMDAVQETQALLDPIAELDMPTNDNELQLLLANSTRGTAFANARALEVPPGTLQELHRPRVYVYELPPWLAQSYELEVNEGADSVYTAYQRLFSTLLRDKTVRTMDPWSANLYYVPAFAYHVSGNLALPHEHIRRVLRFIKAEYPALWARRGGRDHMLWAPGDRGACPLQPDLENLIWLVHFGGEHTFANGGALALTLEVDPFNNSLAGSCFKPNRGIVMPLSLVRMNGQARQTYGPDATLAPPRTTLLLFTGDIRPHDLHYSQGVRQYMFERYGNGSVPDVIITTHVPDMFAMMRASKFCLAPTGHGWGARLPLAMVAGCVPVIVQDYVQQPYEDVLPYDEFSLRVPHAELGELEARLRAITPAHLRALQHGVRRHHAAFVWPARPGRAEPPPLSERHAYYYFVKSLQRRLHAVLAGFHH